MNKVILTGNLTRDPELASTNSGISVCRFAIAVQRRFSNAEGEREVDFFNVTVWRGQADNCHKYLRKGSKCLVEGQVQNRSYTSQTDGAKRTVTEIVAESVEFLGTRQGGEGQERAESTNNSSVSDFEPINDDTLPF